MVRSELILCSEETGTEKANIADISDEKLLELINLVRKTFNKIFKVKSIISLSIIYPSFERMESLLSNLNMN